MTDRRQPLPAAVKPYAWLAVFFVGALAVSIAYQVHRIGPQAGKASVWQPQATANVGRPSSNAGAASTGQHMDEVAPAPAGSRGLAQSESGAPPGSLADEPDLVLRALSASDPDARLDAIHVLAGSGSREALDTLGQVAGTDPVMRNRFVAVDSLRLRAIGYGDADGTIQSLLLAAVADRDPAVAAKARDALAEIAEFLSSGA